MEPGLRPLDDTQKDMRVIFLDFDGVLHPSGGPPGTVLPFEYIDLLAKLLERWPTVGLVVHSSWRDTYSIDELREFLGPVSSRFIGIVAPGPKAEAILAYLAGSPDITSHLVIDDDAAEFPSGFPGAILLCEPLTGLSAAAAQGQLGAWLERTA